MLDRKVKEIMGEKITDVPKMMAILILSLCFISIFINIMIQNPKFLTSQTGYANGGFLNQHFLEAKRLKELLQNGSTNFWYSDNSLGYPMYVTLQPLPSVVSAIVFILFERFVNPLCIFRWLLVSLIALIPISWYNGLRSMDISRAESLIVGLLFLATNSLHHRGFEISAYLQEGLITQLYAHCFFPFAVSSIYMAGKSKKHNGRVVYLICLVYVCNVFTGIYCSIVGFVTHFLSFLVNRRPMKEIEHYIVSHLKVMLYLSWLIIPCLISYPYIGGGTVKQYGGGFSLARVIDVFNDGLFFDCKRTFPWLTIMVCVGIVLSAKHVIDIAVRAYSKSKEKPRDKKQEIYFSWLLLVTIVSCFIYMNNPALDALMNVMPFDLDFDNRSFMIGLHFCGALLAGKALYWISNLANHSQALSEITKKVCKIAFVLLVSLALVKTGSERITERLSMMEMSEEFVQTLTRIKNKDDNSRMLLHSRLGTGGSWDMSNIPILSGKPGAISYSNGWDDSLSAFYINSMPFGSGGVPIKDLKPFLRLYNIRYLVTSSSYVDDEFDGASFLKQVHTVDDLVFYEVQPTYFYGEVITSYFEFVRIPGHIDGRLKSARETVQESLHLYSSGSLLYLNPRQSSRVRKEGIINAQVLDVTSQSRSISGDVSLVTWKFDEQGMSSDEALKQTEMMYEVEIQSEVVEQRLIGVEYHAIVDVAPDEEFINLEHLLLKISYHPFWRCVYFPVDDEYTLEHDENLKFIPRNRSYACVDHVAPNLISVTLPMGRYHVVFRYRTPGILKLMLLLCLLLFFNNSLNLSLFTKTYTLLAAVWNRMEMYETRLLYKSFEVMNNFYYRVLDENFEHTLRKLSDVSIHTSRLDKRKEISGWIKNTAITCKHSLNSFRGIVPSTQGRESRKPSPERVLKEYSIPRDDISFSSSRSKDTLPMEVEENNNEHLIVENIDFGKLDYIINEDDMNKGDIPSSDLDSSIDTVFSTIRSPPTPPKHIKKSYRKRSARSTSNSDEGIKRPALVNECKKTPSIKAVNNRTPALNDDHKESLEMNDFHESSPSTNDGQQNSINDFQERSPSKNDDQQNSMNDVYKRSPSTNDDQQNSMNDVYKRSPSKNDDQQNSMNDVYKRSPSKNDDQQNSMNDVYERSPSTNDDQQNSMNDFHESSPSTNHGQQNSMNDFDESSPSINDGQQNSINDFNERSSSTNDGQQNSMNDFYERSLSTNYDKQNSIGDFHERSPSTNDGQQNSINDFYKRSPSKNDGQQNSINDFYKRSPSKNDGQQNSINDVYKSSPSKNDDQQNSINNFDERSPSTNDGQQNSMNDVYKRSPSTNDGQQNSMSDFCESSPSINDHHNNTSPMKNRHKKQPPLKDENQNISYTLNESLFQTSEQRSSSPILGSILNSLRKNSTSPRKGDPSPRIEKFSHTPFMQKQLSKRSGNDFYKRSPSKNDGQQNSINDVYKRSPSKNDGQQNSMNDVYKRSPSRNNDQQNSMKDFYKRSPSRNDDQQNSMNDVYKRSPSKNDGQQNSLNDVCKRSLWKIDSQQNSMNDVYNRSPSRNDGQQNSLNDFYKRSPSKNDGQQNVMNEVYKWSPSKNDGQQNSINDVYKMSPSRNDDQQNSLNDVYKRSPSKNDWQNNSTNEVYKRSPSRNDGQQNSINDVYKMSPSRNDDQQNSINDVYKRSPSKNDWQNNSTNEVYKRSPSRNDGQQNSINNVYKMSPSRNDDQQNSMNDVYKRSPSKNDGQQNSMKDVYKRSPSTNYGQQNSMNEFYKRSLSKNDDQQNSMNDVYKKSPSINNGQQNSMNEFYKRSSSKNDGQQNSMNDVYKRSPSTNDGQQNSTNDVYKRSPSTNDGQQNSMNDVYKRSPSTNDGQQNSINDVYKRSPSTNDGQQNSMNEFYKRSLSINDGQQDSMNDVYKSSPSRNDGQQNSINDVYKGSLSKNDDQQNSINDVYKRSPSRNDGQQNSINDVYKRSPSKTDDQQNSMNYFDERSPSTNDGQQNSINDYDERSPSTNDSQQNSMNDFYESSPSIIDHHNNTSPMKNRHNKQPPLKDEKRNISYTLNQSLFQTSEQRSSSPILGSILNSLRKNSTSPQKDDPSPRIEKFSHTPFMQKQLSKRAEKIAANESSPNRSNCKENSLPLAGCDQSKEPNQDLSNSFDSGGEPNQDLSNCCDSGGEPNQDLSNRFDSGGEPNQDRSNSFDSGGEPNQDLSIRFDSGGKPNQDLSNRFDSGGEPNQDLSNRFDSGGEPNKDRSNSLDSGGECEWDNLLFCSGSNNVEGSDNKDGLFKDQDIKEDFIQHEIDVTRLVSTDSVESVKLIQTDSEQIDIDRYCSGL